MIALRLGTGNITYLQEAVNKVARQSGLGVLFRAEVLEHMRCLLPEVERFLATRQSHV